MSTNIYRFLTNVKNDPDANKVLKITEDTFPDYEMGAQTPLLNHYLSTEINLYGNPSTLFLNEQPSEMLDYIRKLAQKKSVHKLNKHQTDTPIEFICLGYQDHDGDFVIDKIIVPALVELKKNCKNINEVIEKLYDYTPSKNEKLETLANYFDYLKYTNLDQIGSIGQKPLALIGTTKPIIPYKDHTENCPRFAEIAKSIVPGDIKFDHNILTGILTVSPYNIRRTQKGFEHINGSLECVITNYKISKKTKYATPKDITNITKCMKTNTKGKLEEIEISKSNQPSINVKAYEIEQMLL